MERAAGSFITPYLPGGNPYADVEQSAFHKEAQNQLLTEKLVEAMNNRRAQGNLEPNLMEQGAASANVDLPTFQAFREARRTGIQPTVQTPESVAPQADTAGAITDRVVTPAGNAPKYPQFNEPETQQRLTQALAQSLAALSATNKFGPQDISQYSENVATTGKLQAETKAQQQKNMVMEQAIKAAQGGDFNTLRLLAGTQGHDIFKPENEGGSFQWYGVKDGKQKVLGFFNKQGQLVSTVGSPVDAHAEPMTLNMPFPPMPATDTATGKPILITPSRKPGEEPGVIPGVEPYKKPSLAEGLLDKAGKNKGGAPKAFVGDASKLPVVNTQQDFEKVKGNSWYKDGVTGKIIYKKG